MSKVRSKLRLSDFRRELAYAGLVTFLVMFLEACGPAQAPDLAVPATDQPISESADLLQAIEEVAAEEGYPVQVIEESTAEDAYPGDALPLPSATIDLENYPPPATVEIFSEPRFRFDLPLNAGNRLVTGQAPPDLALAIVDITYNGSVLGVGASDSDGHFSIGVQELPDGHRVGITFAELQPGKTHAEMSREYFSHRGEGFMNIPKVGIFFDTALVTS